MAKKDYILIRHLNNFWGVVFAVRAIPVVVRNGFERRIEALHMSQVLALLAEQQRGLIFPENKWED